MKVSNSVYLIGGCIVKEKLCLFFILATLLFAVACNSTPAETPPVAGASVETPPSTETPPAAPVETPAKIENNVAIEWVEPALEALVRKELDKPEGTIYQEELDYITSVELFGESHLFINNDGGLFLVKGNRTKGVDLHYDDGRGNIFKDGTYEVEGQQYTRGSISSVADFANFRNLTRLAVHKNRLLDLTGMELLINLMDLVLIENDIQEAGALASLKQLGFLILNYNNIADMSAFSGFDRITDLYLTGNQISNLDWLASFSSVIWLQLGYNPLINLDGLENMENLEYLDLTATQVEDISALAGNTSLKKLYLINLKTKSFDLAQLTIIPNLESLGITQDQTELINFRSLAELKKLEALFVTRNANVTDEDIEWLREQLPSCDIVYVEEVAQ